jgi:glycosyltransferase involved in cell wall biosynthesis
VIAPLTALGPDSPLERTGLVVPGQPRYLFVGRFIERKGIDVLLAAFRHVGRGELWLAGDGPHRSLLEGEAKGDPRIRFLGYADEGSLPDLYRQADVLVVPSLFEPWGLVVHEGLGNGLPVIATDQVAAADDLIDPGLNGYVVPAGSDAALASAMRSVAEWSPSHWREAAARTRETLLMYGIDRAADAFVRGCLRSSAPSRAERAPGVGLTEANYACSSG